MMQHKYETNRVLTICPYAISPPQSQKVHQKWSLFGEKSKGLPGHDCLERSTGEGQHEQRLCPQEVTNPGLRRDILYQTVSNNK